MTSLELSTRSALSKREGEAVMLDNIARLSNAASWIDECDTGETGKPIPNLYNAHIGLQAQWPNAFAYDQMLCAPVLMQAIDGENDFTPRTVTDVDVGRIQKKLQHLGL